MPRLIVMHIVSDLFSEYLNMPLSKQLQCNKAKLSEPASINGLHNIRVYARASLLSAYTNENRGGHIYTVTKTLVAPLPRYTTYGFSVTVLHTSSKPVSLYCLHPVTVWHADVTYFLYYTNSFSFSASTLLVG